MNRAEGPLAPQRWRKAHVPLLFKQHDMLKNEIPKQSFENDNTLLILTINSSTLKIITQYYCIHSKMQDVFFKH